MNFLIIGHSVVDVIEGDVNSAEKPGGIYYTVLGMNLIKKKSDNIFLLSSMDPNKYFLFEPVFKNIDLKYIKETKLIPQVNLTLCRNNERGEKYKNLTSKLDVLLVEDFSTIKGILLNMITGFDIDLNDLKLIRMKYDGLVYIDIHTLSRGLDEENRRLFRKIPKAEEWLDLVDIVQVNERELLTLSEEKKEIDIINSVLNLRPQILIVTKGSNGATAYFKQKNRIFSVEKPALKTKSVNQVGCGDVFGAVFFYSYIVAKNIEASLNAANIAGGLITACRDLNKFDLLKNDFLQRLN